MVTNDKTGKGGLSASLGDWVFKNAQHHGQLFKMNLKKDFLNFI